MNVYLRLAAVAPARHAGLSGRAIHEHAEAGAGSLSPPLARTSAARRRLYHRRRRRRRASTPYARPKTSPPKSIGCPSARSIPRATRLPAWALTPPSPSLPPPELSRFTSAAALYRKGDRVGGGWARRPDLRSAATDRAGLGGAEGLSRSRSPDRLRKCPSGLARRGLDARHAGRVALPASANPRRRSMRFFARDPPRTPAGVLAAARAALDDGRKDKAADLVRELWRDADLDSATEAKVLREFGALLLRADHKYRADRLLYAEKIAPALRAAALAGADEVALANARIEAMRGPLTPRAILAVPASLQADPGLIFARVQDARRGNRTPRGGGLGWRWRRMTPRRSSIPTNGGRSAGWSRASGSIAAISNPPISCARAPRPRRSRRMSTPPSMPVGIALRFLNDAHAAARRFAEASEVALTPLAHARADYWRGRAGRSAEQRRRKHAGSTSAPPATRSLITANSRSENWAVTALLRRARRIWWRRGRRARRRRGPSSSITTRALDDFATSLAFSAARIWSDESQIAALGRVLARRGDARTNVTFGKLATERGFAIDETAFPTFGLPRFSPLAHSADIASVLAVARQESEFSWRAASGAGAKGLMQILPATAEMTARRAGVPFDFGRLIADPAFNLQLGASLSRATDRRRRRFTGNGAGRL